MKGGDFRELWTCYVDFGTWDKITVKETLGKRDEGVGLCWGYRRITNLTENTQVISRPKTFRPRYRINRNTGVVDSVTICIHYIVFTGQLLKTHLFTFYLLGE